MVAAVLDALNYQHLFYFMVIAEEGSLVGAGKRLRLTHSTLSASLRALEGYLGAELFERRGRRLALTQLGTEVASYASDIFRMGGELVELARGRGGGRQTPFRAGVVGTVPRSVAGRLLEPVFALPDLRPLQLRQDSPARLFEELAAGRLHVVISDAPPGASRYRLHAHVLGETEVLLFATKALAAEYGHDFPRSLDGSPFVFPAAGTLRRAMDQWLTDRGLRVRVAAEVEDAGMLRALGGLGLGLFPVRAALRAEVEESYGAVSVGALTGVRDTYYVVSAERQIRHPGVAAIVGEARAVLMDVPEQRKKRGR